jgi:guanylate kinase
MKKFRSQLLVLSAPSGAGKTTIARALTKRFNEFTISVSATTRRKRPGEKEGRDYHFLSVDEFKKNIRRKNFLEYEEVHGDLYGTLKSTVQDLLEQGRVVIFDIDVNGALSIKRIYPQAILIFIKPPSLAELRKRLKNRKSESGEAIDRRLKRIEFEYAQAEKFDHILINDHLEHAVQQIEQLILLK